LKAGVFSEIKDVCIPRIFIFSFDINWHITTVHICGCSAVFGYMCTCGIIKSGCLVYTSPQTPSICLWWENSKSSLLFIYFFFIFLLLFICAYKAWFISPPGAPPPP
jgi:hypothetical protein